MPISLARYFKTPTIKAVIEPYNPFLGFNNPIVYDGQKMDGNGSDTNPIKLNEVNIVAKKDKPTTVETKLNNSNLWILGVIGLGLIIATKS